MKKFFKAVLFLVALLLTGAIVIAAIGFHYVRRMPAFYKTYEWTKEEADRLNTQALNKLALAHDRMNAAVIAERNAATRNSTLPVSHESFKISFTEEELNAVLRKNYSETLAPYVEGPGLYFRDEKLILAGKAKDYGYLLSFYFEPRIGEDGKLKLSLVKILGGQLSIPKSALSSKFDDLRKSVDKHLPGWQQTAKYKDSRAGGANTAAINAALSKLLLSILDDKTAEPVIFVPNDRGSQPLRLKDVKIGEGELTLEVQPLTPAEREKVMDEIKRPIYPFPVAGVEAPAK